MAKTISVIDRAGRDNSTEDPFTADLEALRLKHNLSGCVLVAFDPRAANASATAAGRTPGFHAYMKTLGDHILACMDDPENGLEMLPTT